MRHHVVSSHDIHLLLTNIFCKNSISTWSGSILLFQSHRWSPWRRSRWDKADNDDGDEDTGEDDGEDDTDGDNHEGENLSMSRMLGSDCP